MLVAILFANAPAQTHRVHGTVRDASTYELLPYAYLSVAGVGPGTASSEKGEFTLSLKPGTYTLSVNLIGYRTETVPINVEQDGQVLNIRLTPTDILLQEVTVFSSATSRVHQTEVGTLALQSQRLVQTTSIIPDVFRSIQTLPGISSNNEFSARFNVRGGTPDENLVLVNGAQVYEPFHVKEAPNASIGIFNIDLMRTVTLVTGGFSARYGDRMSSVMDIEYREGNRDLFQGAATLGMTGVELFLEGPIGSAGSFIVGGRKSYVEYAMSFLNLDETIHPSFYDVQGVVGVTLSPGNKLQFEFIHAGDRFILDPTTTTSGPSQYATTYKGKSALFRESGTSFEDEHARYISNLFDLQSSHVVSNSLFLRNELSLYEQIEQEVRFGLSEFSRDIQSTPNYFYRSRREESYSNDLTVRTIEAKSSGSLRLSPAYELNIGASGQAILYEQSLVDQRTIEEQSNTSHYPDTAHTVRIEDAVDAANERIDARSFKIAAYCENVIQVNDQLLFNCGVRLDYFDINRDFRVSPRLNLAYRLTKHTTFRAAWGIFTQSPIYRQLAYSFASDTNTKAQEAFHTVIGAEHSLPLDNAGNAHLTFKLELFVKKYSNLVSSSRTSSGRITYSRKNDATGSARGIDAYLALNLPGFGGWISYGLLDAREDLFADKIGEYPRFTDQRHTLSVVANWELGSGWSTNLRFQYGSGYPYTPSKSQYNATAKRWEWVQGMKNSATLPPYRRLDLRGTKQFMVFGLSASAFLDISNALDFKNVQSYRYRYNSNGMPYVQELTLWPVLPTLGLTVRF
jgi:outer membrane receptor for ferrienterochelin and colicin